MCNHSHDGGSISGLHSKLSNREELSTLLAVTIFTSTAQHAATNNGQVLYTYLCLHTVIYTVIVVNDLSLTMA